MNRTALTLQTVQDNPLAISVSGYATDAHRITVQQGFVENTLFLAGLTFGDVDTWLNQQLSFGSIAIEFPYRPTTSVKHLSNQNKNASIGENLVLDGDRFFNLTTPKYSVGFTLPQLGQASVHTGEAQYLVGTQVSLGTTQYRLLQAYDILAGQIINAWLIPFSANPSGSILQGGQFRKHPPFDESITARNVQAGEAQNAIPFSFAMGYSFAAPLQHSNLVLQLKDAIRTGKDGTLYLIQRRQTENNVVVQREYNTRHHAFPPRLYVEYFKPVSPADAIASFLQGSGLGIFGEDIFVSTEPASAPANCITVYDTGGHQDSYPDYPELGAPSVQVRVRSSTYLDGFNVARTVRSVLHGAVFPFNSTLFESIWMVGDINPIGKTQNDLRLFTLNFNMLTKEQIT